MGLKIPTLIHQFLEESAKNYPDKVALIHEGTRATYAEVDSSADRFAGWLRDHGIKQGERIALLLENGLEYVIAYYGTLKAGAVVSPLSGDAKADGLSYLLKELEPSLIVSSSKFEKRLQSTDLSFPSLKYLVIKNPALPWSFPPYHVLAWEDLTSHESSPRPDIPIEESALASIIYTSGSMGKPKGVMLSHRNIVSNTNSICQYLHLTEKDVQMAVLPFYYVMGKSLLNTHFARGGTVVINNTFAFPATVIRQMADEHVTGFSGVPSTYAYLLHRSPLASYRDKLASLRYCSQAGGHMSRAVKEELRKVLPPHTKIYIMYGATEAGARLAYLDPDKFEEKMDSIGKAIPDVELRVLTPDGEEAFTGQIGELVASGPNIMQGYWKDRELTEKVLMGPWYHTGDQAFKDSEGYFYVVGRKDDLVKVGGHRVSLQEVEDGLMESGLFVEASVVALPDHLLGHRLIALAVAKEKDCDRNGILTKCAERLPRYKLPSTVKLVRALPKSFTGKIDRDKCVDLLKSFDSERNSNGKARPLPGYLQSLTEDKNRCAE